MKRDGHVRVLPLHVANKIAAGEVVERPASVVKELVENAIDAGAKKIAIGITQGGRKLVSVQDDGCGMTKDDAVLSLERQATSKILDVEDIEQIDTLGFRGEAIPSIASVSRFSIPTKGRSSRSTPASSPKSVPQAVPWERWWRSATSSATSLPDASSSARTSPKRTT